MHGEPILKVSFHRSLPTCILSRLAFPMLLLLAIGARTQEPSASLLTPGTQAVLDRLAAIGSGIPDGEWRYHTGDLPHGEDPRLDDSEWKSIKGSFTAPVETTWFRQTVTVPAMVGGFPVLDAPLSFDFNCRSDSGTTMSIVYLNGRRIAMGDNLEPIVLVEHPRSGEVLHLAVKVLQTTALKRKKPSTFTFAWPSDRLAPSDLYAEVETALVLLPTMTQDHSVLEQQMALLEKALGEIDLKSLDGGDASKFEASMGTATKTLEPLRPVLRTLDVKLIGNSHIDTAWLWPISETTDIVHRTFGTALQLMEEYPNYKYTQSVALYSAWMQEKYPDLFADMVKRTKEGRWEPLGGMWIEPDLNMPDGESQVRQLLIGTRYFKSEMGVDVKIGWNPDSFGYNWQLPQIYKKSGIDYFVTQKMDWNKENKLPLKIFWWESPDGSRVLTYFPHAYNRDPDPVLLGRDFAQGRERAPGETSLMHLYGVGDHGGGPTRSILDQAEHWMQPNMIYPHVEYSTATDFFAEIAPKVEIPAGTPEWNYVRMAEGKLTLPPAPEGKINVPVWKDELYLETHRAVSTTQSEHKKHMREEEERMLNAEKVASIAWLGGGEYPSSKLNEAWKLVLVGQFHDTAAGSAVASVYRDAERDYESVREATGEILRSDLDEIAAHVNTQQGAGSVPVLIFNPLAWQRTDVVEMDVQMPRPVEKGIEVFGPDGHPLLTQVLSEDKATARYRLLVRAEDVPSLGYVVLQVRDGHTPVKSDLTANAAELENSFLKLKLDPSTGCIVELTDKATGFNSIAAGGCGNELQTFVDTPKSNDAWDLEVEALSMMTPLHEVDSFSLIEKGPLRATIRIERHMGKSKFVEFLRLYAGIPRVDVDNDFDWHETHILLKAAFPLAASADNATYEIPYGTIKRPTTRNNSIEKAKFEVAALRWADLGDGQHGFSLLNASKYGYDGVGNVLRLSLLRSPIYPDPTADRGEHKFVYSLYPHAGTWQQAQTERRGYEVNYLLMAIQTESHAGTLGSKHSFASVDGGKVIATALKKAEDGNALIFRMFEWAGETAPVKITMPGSPTSAAEVGTMETEVRSTLTLKGNVVETTIHPFEIQTVRVNYGSADGSVWQERH
jgi:alpha-mannosidase